MEFNKTVVCVTVTLWVGDMVFLASRVCLNESVGWLNSVFVGIDKEDSILIDLSKILGICTNTGKVFPQQKF